MADASLVFRSATELAACMAAGQVTAVEVVTAHLDQIRRWNPKIRAVVSLRAAEALREGLRHAARHEPVGA